MRSFVLSILGLTFGLFALSPFVQGNGGPAARPAAANAKAAPAVQLPITRVVLFNAGIGYFHREGEITGEARLDLRFEEMDVNDLLKSIVLTDKDGGKIRAVTYDNRMPLEFTLKGFSVDVTENPTVGQLLHQVRGEKVEITDKSGVVTAGQIVSVERQPPPPAGTPDPGELINILTDDGLQSVELKHFKKIKFNRAELQGDFKKALELLASSRGDNKKAVSVMFSGNGKRRVAVGYVTEAPLWKPSYRLTVDEKGAARIQGWATVENTTDEDWNNVKVGLVAGRPMTFQMDMYDPLFVPRPRVEPELFASLRPPMYQGGLNPSGMMGVAGVGGIGGGFNFNGGNFNFNGGGFNIGGGNFNIGGGQLGQFGNVGGQLGVQGGQFGNLGAQFGFQGGFNGYAPYLPRVPRPNIRSLYGDRLSFQDYLKRLHGQGTPAPTSDAQKPIRDPLDKTAGALAAADGRLGDMFEYKIEEPITLSRQQSAMLPLVNEAVEGSRVSIYNAAVLAKYPLLGLKLVNKTKLHLAQGPVAVFDGETFAGDARLPDLKPGETRLISYAIDLGSEVVSREGEKKTTLLGVKVAGGEIDARVREVWPTKYLIRNRNSEARTVVIEHPRVAGRKLLTPEKPADQTRSFYRFEVVVKSGELATLEVIEEAEERYKIDLVRTDTERLLYYSKQAETKPAVRDVIAKALELRAKVEEAKKAIEAEREALKEIADDQDRIRKNIEKAPKESETFKRYLRKFDEQETDIEKRQARINVLKGELAKHVKAMNDFAETARAE